ncbi:MAG: DegV family protein [Bacillota bacterium]
MNKNKIALITDSTSDIPESVAQELDIKIVPLQVVYPEAQFRDGVDIQTSQVYDQMPEKIPTTSTPRSEDLLAVLKKIVEDGYEKIFAIHISSGLSGTFSMVETLAKQMVSLPVHVEDSKSISLGLGFQAIEAAKMIREGLDFEKIIQRIRELRPQVQVYYVLKTLEYLQRGGRIGRVSAVLGSLMDIKPIISIDEEGKYYPVAKERGRKKSIDRLINIVIQKAGRKPVNLAVLHGAALEEAQHILDKLKEALDLRYTYLGQVSPVTGVHTGPGLLGVGFFPTEY